MILNCVIIDDELPAIELLSEHVENTSNLKLLKVFSQPLTALREIKLEDQIDIIFLDVEMPEISGIELAVSLRSKTRFLVFTSSHSKYAFEAFGLDADHYILKPITFLKFSATIDKLLKIIRKTTVNDSNTDKPVAIESPIGKFNPGNSTETEPYSFSSNGNLTLEGHEEIFLKTGINNKIIRLKLSDIIYIQSNDNYIDIYTDHEKITAYLTLKEAISSFNYNSNLVQIHRSYIIAKNRIKLINGNTVNLVTGLELPIGSSYKESFFEYIRKQTIVSGRIKPSEQ